MNIHTAVVCLLLSAVTVSLSPAQRKEVIGYFPSWRGRDRNSLVSPATIPYDKFTIINYAFFAPMIDGSIAAKDSLGEALYLRGAPGSRLTDLAHEHGVKVLLSLGGWDDSDNFPAVAAGAKLRMAFADACIEAIRAYGFDGIDIDWEFPGYAEHKGTPDDKRNFTDLLRTIRERLTAYGRQTQRQYLLTAALPAESSNAGNIDVKEIAEILDQLSLMTYDFSGPWDPRSYHNSPLYAPQGADSGRSLDGAFKLYHRTYGIAADKINLGVAFYGKTFTHCSALNTPHEGADTVHFSIGLYYEILNNMGKFKRRWDDQAKVPYLVSTEWNELVCYDDPESIRAKANYVVENGIHGLIIWEITGDHLSDGTTPLLDAMVSAFRANR